jgi:hypothetical protein
MVEVWDAQPRLSSLFENDLFTLFRTEDLGRQSKQTGLATTALCSVRSTFVDIGLQERLSETRARHEQGLNGICFKADKS